MLFLGEIMGLILGLIFGILIGAGIAYMVLKGAIAQRDQEIQQHKRTISDLEQSHESRLRDTVKSLQTDYQRQADQKTAALSQQYETQIQALKQQVTKLQAASVQPKEVQPKEVQPKPAPSPNQPQAARSQSSTATPSPAVPASDPSKAASTDQEKPAVSSATQPKDEPSAPVQPPAASTFKSAPAALDIEQRQNLVNSVLSMGESKSASHLPELKRLAMFPSSEVREAAATAIRSVAEANPGSPVMQQAVPVLGKLSQEPDPTVRCVSVSALGDVPSYKAIPFVRRSLRDSDMRVVKAANEAISRFKYYRGTSKPTKSKKKNFRSPTQANP
jgi:hypothetical protein